MANSEIFGFQCYGCDYTLKPIFVKVCHSLFCNLLKPIVSNKKAT